MAIALCRHDDNPKEIETTHYRVSQDSTEPATSLASLKIFYDTHPTRAEVGNKYQRPS